MTSKQIVTELETKDEFFALLEKNPGLIVMKFGADWCKPCKVIKSNVESFFVQTPPHIICCDLNVDDCDELYSFLRNKRMINGIPTILCYKKGNVSFAPDDQFSGTNMSQLEAFFKRCVIYAKN